ncbi:MAG: 5-(carboxyamino)imidazole ribonucleotide mutase [Candidatus Eisenbacteria bacterium]|uniref:N5-carboxyaminoimidazole ribonucleotide mutase n=1 Tax=Eiseniibacteriota bacterium TaxID=2212470 RepID=A0A937X8E8_UNCEI|nr:5-(carboxyamino)imidazole ribonucleotide mutase [Candidatus Eisenbacteria bacterium]
MAKPASGSRETPRAGAGGAGARGQAGKRGKPVVGVLYGSTSDEPVIKECLQVLERFGVPYEAAVLSAHRMPEKTAAYARGARKRGLRVIVCGAGMAAHLPGVVASLTTLPVIGIPLCGSALEGVDALFSMVQMPAGVPVATVAVGKAGAKNAGVLAAQILALSDPALARRVEELKSRLEGGEKL